MKNLLVLAVAIFSFQAFATTCNGDGLDIEINLSEKKVIFTDGFKGEGKITNESGGIIYVTGVTAGSFKKVIIDTLEGEVDITDSNSQMVPTRYTNCN